MTADQFYEKKADELTDYFIKRYGYENAAFIATRIAVSFKTESIETLKDVGDKIVLFNGWKPKT